MVHPGTFTTARLRRYAPMFLAVFLVAGCVREGAPTADIIAPGLWKVCDHGRAIYYRDSSKRVAPVVVENAPECAK